MSRGSSPWRNRSTKARISIAVSTRRSRRDRVEGLVNRPGLRVVVVQCRGLQAHFTVPLLHSRPEEDQDDDLWLEADVDEA